MAGDPRVLERLEEMLDTGQTPEEVCRGCPDLLAEVRARWQEFRRIDAVVVDLLPDLQTAPCADATTPVPCVADPPQVPGYELAGEVGRGGMGVVYRAHDLNLNRDVAVKLLQDSFATDSPIARRFTDEARITAQIQHPGVPAVYRVGSLADGRPFLAMKLIKGRTLAALLGERQDVAADRGRFVAIFEQVCQAVAYAHSLRVIHRDLKPSNVMVGKFGEVQVMDWGLAKVLSANGLVNGDRTRSPAEDGTVIRTRPIANSDTPGAAGISTPPTQAGSVLGTPAYMAPEQAGGEVDRLDTPCDVFGLGSILCEILTGKPPYTGPREEQVFRKALHADQSEAHARLGACGAEPELVALCKKCMTPNSDDRPRDAGEVASAVAALRAAAEERARLAELDRVRAVEQSRWRRALLAASVTIVAALLAGLSVSLWQMRRAFRAEETANVNAHQAVLNAEEADRNAQKARTERDAKDQALAAERRAREDEAKARYQAFDALRSMTAAAVERKFTQAASLTQDDRAFLRGIIAQFDAFAAIKGDDAESRAVRAEGRFRVATMRYSLGELREALENYDEALNIYGQLAADFPDRPEFRYELARCHTNRGLLLSRTGRLQLAEQDYDKALSIHRELAAAFPLRPDFRRSLAISHNNRGTLLFAARRFADAESDHVQALEIQKRLAAEFPLQPEYREELATSHNNRGVMLGDTGRHDDAMREFDLALKIRRQLADEFPSRPQFRDELAASHNNRGRLLSVTGRAPEAEKEYDRALNIYQTLAGDYSSRPEFRQNLGRAFIGRAALFRNTGRLKEAEQDYNQALSAQRRLAADYPDQPDWHNDLAGTCLNLAVLCLQRQNVDGAKKLLLEGGPHHLAALKASPRHPGYRHQYRNHLGARTTVHARLLERPDAIRTAETCRDLGWDAPADAYNAACYLSLCIPIVAQHDELNADQRAEAVKFYGDEAMKFLNDAVSKGFQDAAHMKKDADLEPLRQRDDFRTMLSELEAKQK